MKNITRAFFAVTLFLNIAWAKETKISGEQRELNYGYTYLYDNLKSFAWTDEVMVVKKETQEVNEVGKDIGQTSGKWANKLQSLQQDYPDLKFDETGQPQVVDAKKRQLKKEKMSNFMPLFGKKGPEFERSLLISSQAAIDDLRILTEILMDMEKNPGLKKVLSEIHRDMERLYDRIDQLLNRYYFKHNTYKKK